MGILDRFRGRRQEQEPEISPEDLDDEVEEERDEVIDDTKVGTIGRLTLETWGKITKRRSVVTEPPEVKPPTKKRKGKNAAEEREPDPIVITTEETRLGSKHKPHRARIRGEKINGAKEGKGSVLPATGDDNFGFRGAGFKLEASPTENDEIGMNIGKLEVESTAFVRDFKRTKKQGNKVLEEDQVIEIEPAGPSLRGARITSSQLFKGDARNISGEGEIGFQAPTASVSFTLGRQKRSRAAIEGEKRLRKLTN